MAVAVASVVYNMAGDITDRPNYLKSLVVQHVIAKGKTTLNERINNGVLRGPGVRLNSFYRWSSKLPNYGLVGLPQGTLTGNSALDPAVLANEIPHGSGVTVTISFSELSQANGFYWAERYVRETYPGAADTIVWTYSINDDGTEISVEMIIPIVGARTETFTPASPDYDAEASYIYARYKLSSSPTIVRIFIYKIGSGNAVLDALVAETDNYGSFFPYIPIRKENEFLSTTNQPSLFAQVTKAYKKATGGAKLDELITQLADNEDIDDIDYAYIVFGVSLNVLDNSCRRYLYRFLDTLRYTQQGGVGAYAVWAAAGFNKSDRSRLSIQGRTTGSSDYNFRISWGVIGEVSGTGLGKVGANPGEFWFQVITDTDDRSNRIRLYQQHTTTSYTYLDILGMVHENYVYGANSVVIWAAKALGEANDSGFIIPLHHDVWRDTGLLSTSQMATACMFIVFNCVEIKKQQWYETGIFKILLVVVIAIVSVVFTGGAGLGILGAHLAVGTALGLSGISAAILGAVVNALAAMVLMTLLEPLLAELGVLGPIVGAIIMFAIGQAAGSFGSTGSIVINWGDLLKVDNLLGMTNSLGQGISNQINQETLELQQQTLDYAEKATAEANKIQQAFFDNFGYGAGVIDPLLFVDAPKGPIAESSSTFLTRTLMTGSEIAEMSRELLYEFPTYSLKLPDAFT